MTMPINLVLVRHGESEGNVATGRSKKGDHSDYTEEFKSRHNSTWRLTDKGIWQAKTAGEWIKANIGGSFDRYYVSDYNRAKETAFYLGLADAAWFVDFNLRERDWGYWDSMSREEREERFAEEIRSLKRDRFYASPPNGESMATICGLRIGGRHFDTLHRECSDMTVISVNHGEIVWAHRVVIERMLPRVFRELDASKNPKNRVHNCQILHYTRKDPETGDLLPYIGWMRSVCPTDPKLSMNVWQKVERPRYTNEQLRQEFERTPRMIAE